MTWADVGAVDDPGTELIENDPSVSPFDIHGLDAYTRVSAESILAGLNFDWAGTYNRYLSCEKGNGAGTFLRIASPSMRFFFAELAEGRGAVGATTLGTSGDRELGLVHPKDMSKNSGSVGGEDHVACP